MSQPSSDTDAAKPKKAKRSKRRLWLRALFGLLLLPFLLVAIVVVLLYLPPIQDVVRGEAVDFLSEKTGTVVTLESLHLRFPLGVKLQGLYVEDQRGDTLLYAGDVRTRVGLRALIGKRILLDPVELSDVRATLHQNSDSVFNFDFIIDAFVGPDTAVVEVQKDSTGGFDFAIGAVHLKRIHYDMVMEPSELALELHLGELELDFDRFTLDPLAFHVDDLVLKNTRIAMRSTSSDPTPPKYPELESPLADIDVRFNGIELEAVSFSMLTTDTGDSLWLSVSEAELATRSIDLTKQHLALSKLSMDGLQFGMLAMAGDDVLETVPVGDPLWLDQDDGFRFWTQDWDLAIEELGLKNSSIAMHSDSIATPALLFDPEHMVFTGIDLSATDMAVSNTRMALALDKLMAHGGPDATPLELAFDLEATPASMVLKDGAINALGNTITFRLEAQPGDLSTAYRTPLDVPIDVEARTILQMAELMPLLREFGVELPRGAATDERWTTHLWLNGTPSRADRMGLDLSGDQGSRILLEGSTRQADRWPHNAFDLQLDELTMGKGMRQVMRAYTPTDIALPQRLTLRGTASGENGTVRTVLALDSDMGRVSGFAVVNNWVGNIPDGVDLAITVAAVDAGRIIGDTALDPLSFKIIAGGERLNNNTRTANLSLTPEVFTYAGNDLSSLRLAAHAHGDSLQVGLAAQAEPADILLRADGRWPQEGDSLALELDLIVRKLHLEELGMSAHTLNSNGRIRGRIAFLPEGLGRVDINADGFRLSNGDRNFSFEHFSLQGLLDTDSTAVELDSDAITLYYHSNMGIDSLVPRTQAKLQSFFQPEGTFTPVPGRRMDLALTLPRTDWLTEIVLPELDALDLERFAGSYDSDTDELTFDIDVPHLDHGGIDVQNLRLEVHAVGNKLQGLLSIQRVERDSIYLENLSLETRTANDTLHAAFQILDGEREQYKVGLSLRREAGVPVLHMDQVFKLNHRDWTAHPENALRLTDDGPRAEHFELQSNGERLALRTGTQRNHIELTDFRLSTLSELVNSSDTTAVVRGRTTGTISLPFTEQARLGADLTIVGLEAMGTRIGDLRLQASELQTDHYRAQIALTDPRNNLQAKVDADLTGAEAIIRGDAELGFNDLSFLKPFVSDYLFSLSGGLSGNLRYQQQGDDMRIMGRTIFNDARVGVIQTGAVYRLPKETMVFDERGILFENVAVLDSSGNRFKLDGRILTTTGDQPQLDMRLRTERFQLVNSTIEQNDMFFGDLFGSIDLKIEGPAISPVVKGDVGILEGTSLSIVLPGSKVELVEHEGIVLFTDDYGAPDSLDTGSDSRMLRDSLAAQLPGVELDLRIRLDKRARFAVVIDPTTGDQATFSGEADLVFRYTPDGELYLRGPFTVAEGGYTLEFYGLVKKRFELVPGGTVRWDGDIMNGQMNIQARYRSETAPFALVANARGGIPESERNRLQQRLPFDVLINIREQLSAPEISFGLDLDRMSRNSFPQVNSRLEELSQQANEEELNRQVFGLLVLNTFIQDETGDSGPSTSLATTAARNSVNALLTDQLNRVTGNVVKGMDIQLGVNTYDQAAGGELYQRTSVDYKVSQRVLNDRVTIEAGGSVGVDERGQNVSGVSNTRAAQYAIMYDLTKDGRLRLRAFHENAFDLYDGEIFNNGIAIMLTREFEENMRSREKRREAIRKEQQATRPEDETP